MVPSAYMHHSHVYGLQAIFADEAIRTVIKRQYVVDPSIGGLWETLVWRHTGKEIVVVHYGWYTLHNDVSLAGIFFHVHVLARPSAVQ